MACGWPKNITHGWKFVEDIINMLNKKFCEECLLATAQCKVLEYLEMTFNYKIKGQVKIINVRIHR